MSDQDARDHPDDIVIARIRKSSRESIEIRLRTITGTRMVLVRLGREDAHGTWRPLASNSRCGISLRASILSEALDALEKAEDTLFDEGHLR